ncbi:MAG: Gfo/Idh/MocA family oxidoreductase [Bryobacteraceae bacterium]|nr:Gfo/Idh/MocA family oxidoreductase [Bryobacteraceae bacterium]MDW8378776.1 Gfo/Idh/MocA family oxidoreductase [Bryobacterales bacterium]
MFSIALFLGFFSLLPAPAQIKLGIVGTDTSHVLAFTSIFHDVNNPNHVPGARIVAAFKGGSPDVESSRTRVDQYAKELESKWGVEIVPTISALCPKVDGFLLESVDGRKHLPQFREIATCGKPVFIDKPLASTLEDAREIARIGKEKNVPWFSTSSLRYTEACVNWSSPQNLGVITWGPGPTEEHHYLDLSWYAVHPIEMLFTLMGRGCETVTRTVGKNADEITCRWKDGRIGTVRSLRPSGDYGVVVFREKEILQSPPKMRVNYAPMLKEVVRFFQTKQPPVPNEDTLEIFAFMDAAQKSKEQGGKPVKLR